MSLIYIKFAERRDEARGLGILADNSRVDAFRGGVYRVREQDLDLLNSASLGYRRATDDEIQEATAGAIVHTTAR